jgi:CheY-like chemotaxis protein
VKLLKFNFSTILPICANHAGLIFLQKIKNVFPFGNKIELVRSVDGYRAIHNPGPAKEMLENSGKKIRALIIDDEVDICYLLRGMLRQKNIDASYVTTLADAEAHLQKNDPPVIFLDNHLSDGLGVEHIAGIKANHPATFIIMITAHDTSADREIAYKKGVDLFIGKPFTKEMILKAVEKIGSA